MAGISVANIKKARYYLKRNGLKKTWYAVCERLNERRQQPYCWEPVSRETLSEQRKKQEEFTVTFSILVPAYRTGEVYLRELVDSLQNQSYPKWELILADATEDDRVEKVVETYSDARIRYVKLQNNAGISENTNQALQYATGEYVGLLDHDDVLTLDALYEMAARIEMGKKQNETPWMLYSDEDKCNGDGTEYFEPNLKEDFNLDLLLSNNYICHFLVMKKELIQALKFRPEYDGAQDFDLVLRAAWELRGKEHLIIHVPKVLYHWRCHIGSTAENPQSKLYAYEAGKRAIEDYVKKSGWDAEVRNTPHVGFYTLRYKNNPFEVREDLGVIGGRVVKRGRVVSGRLKEDGQPMYEGLSEHYSGYLHRAILPQDAAAVDIRNLRLRKECMEIFEQVTGVKYITVAGDANETEIFDVSRLPENCDYLKISLQLCRALTCAGYRILYLPE